MELLGLQIMPDYPNSSPTPNREPVMSIQHPNYARQLEDNRGPHFQVAM